MIGLRRSDQADYLSDRLEITWFSEEKIPCPKIFLVGCFLERSEMS
jgi:hypothetical protein